MKKTITMLSLLVLLVSCGSSSKLAYLEKEYAVRGTPANLIVNSISFVDKRPEITYREIKIPSLAFPWHDDQVYPEFTEYDKNTIRGEIYKLATRTGTEVDIVVTLLEGKMKYDCKFWGESEYVKVAMRFNFYDGVHEPCMYSYKGEAWYEVTSWHASKDYIEQLYQKVLKDCTNQCFNEIQAFEKESQIPGKQTGDMF